ncbi:Tat (twin-arginine translocation) pathway signal sequence domain protein, partial [Halobellus sp. Atlit-38R]
AAWWVEDNNTGEHSTPITVDVGDELSGAIVQQDNGEWYIDIINKTTGEYTYLYSPNYDDRTFDKATLTLEANNYTQDQDCAKLPGQTTFSSVDLYDLNDDAQSPECDKTKYQYLTKHPRLAVSEA